MPEHITKISTVKKWERAVWEAERMLRAIDANEPIQGSDWARGMRRHWKQRLQTLLDNDPRQKR